MVDLLLYLGYVTLINHLSCLTFGNLKPLFFLTFNSLIRIYSDRLSIFHNICKVIPIEERNSQLFQFIARIQCLFVFSWLIYRLLKLFNSCTHFLNFIFIMALLL